MVNKTTTDFLPGEAEEKLEPTWVYLRDTDLPTYFLSFNILSEILSKKTGVEMHAVHQFSCAVHDMSRHDPCFSQTPTRRQKGGLKRLKRLRAAPTAPSVLRLFRCTWFSSVVDFVSYTTNSTLVAEPPVWWLPACALRDDELFVPAETYGEVGSSRPGLVASTSCAPHPGRDLCP